MNLIQIAILALVQGAAELLPVSSSAHVITAEKLMGLDPTSPEMTFLLVMLHTGTMFAVIFYFWKDWKSWFLRSRTERMASFKRIIVATVCTGVFGLVLKEFIEKVILHGTEHAEIEHIFGNLLLISASLFAAGVLILVSGLRQKRVSAPEGTLGTKESAWIGAVQGICLPFRGFSRSGATISTGLLLGIPRRLAEEFSFLLAVVLTPPVVARELGRLLKAHAFSGPSPALKLTDAIAGGMLGMMLAFIAGLGALRWLSSWLEKGKWQHFGYYCLVVSLIIFALHFQLG